MKSTGIIKKLSTNGIICIPKEIRETLKLKEDDSIEFTVHGREIHLRKYQEGCVFCNNKTATLIEHNGLKVCWSCARHLGHKVDC